MSSILTLAGISKRYPSGNSEVSPLVSVDLNLEQGDMMAIIGASGSGKTTLLNIMAGLDRPSEGQVSLIGKDIAQLSDNDLASLRNEHIGFVFQFHHLLAEFSALDNVLMPIRIRRKPNKADHHAAQTVLAAVGLANRSHHKPSQLSGGERQRVAIARALVHQPKLVFMDEPTGNLDETTSAQIQALLLQLNEQFQASFVVVTHSQELAGRFDRVMEMKGGKLISISSPLN